jgi:hypothetical protein
MEKRMKFFKIKALKFQDGTAVDEQSNYIVQQFKKTFSIWMDPYGDVADGADDGIYAGLDDSECKSLEDVKALLLAKELVDNDSQFIDLEDE